MVVMASCNVRVAAHDNALGSDVQVNFTLNETNYLTPHNLTLESETIDLLFLMRINMDIHLLTTTFGIQAAHINILRQGISF